MRQFSCSNCGYDLTGIEQLANNTELMIYSGGGQFPFSGESILGMSNGTNISCPNCGQVGNWLKY